MEMESLTEKQRINRTFDSLKRILMLVAMMETELRFIKGIGYNKRLNNTLELGLGSCIGMKHKINAVLKESGPELLNDIVNSEEKIASLYNIMYKLSYLDDESLSNVEDTICKEITLIEEN